MKKSLYARLMVVFVACLLSAVMLWSNQTACRYLTSIQGEFTLSPKQQASVTATLQDGEITVSGGDAYIYLYLPEGVELVSATAQNDMPISYQTEDIVSDTAVHKAYGDGKICRFLVGTEQMTFLDGQTITIESNEIESNEEKQIQLIVKPINGRGGNI